MCCADNDITRRVLSEAVDPASTKVRDVMTKKPKCVQMEDSALDALEMMVDNRFRHLPVLDKDGMVVGLLDIAKCLYDAISILEKVHDGKSESEAVSEAVSQAMKRAAGGARSTNKAQLAAMQAMMEQMFGGSVPTLRKIIGSERVVSVGTQSTVREASVLMGKLRKGVLVMKGKELVGIITPKVRTVLNLYLYLCMCVCLCMSVYVCLSAVPCTYGCA